MFELLKLQFWWYPPHFLRLGGCFKSQLKPLGWGCITVVESGIPSIAQGLSWETSHRDYAYANWHVGELGILQYPAACLIMIFPRCPHFRRNPYVEQWRSAKRLSRVRSAELSCLHLLELVGWLNSQLDTGTDPKKVPVPRQLLSGRENREMWLETMLCHWNLGSCKPSYDQDLSSIW